MAEAKNSERNFEDTPEFQRAVQHATAATVAQILPQLQAELLAKVQAQAPSAAAADAFGIAERIALAIAEVSDQGTSRKRVAPEVLAARAKAALRATELIREFAKSGDIPAYSLVSHVYLNERLIPPFRVDPATKQPVRQEITWTGMPSEAMRPMNEPARRVYTAFRESIGSSEGIASTDKRPMWVTPGGLTVKGDPPARRFVASEEPFLDDLTVHTANDPTAPEVAVLGTIAPRAKQSQQGALPH